MRKKLDTRFPAARIKKIMQADEDIGKIALAVPVLVSKALELFLQDLCNRTYDITLQRGMKTVSSSHLKQCINSFNVFDFLKDTVSKVPDVGVSDAGSDDRAVKKRKPAEEDNDSEEAKKSRTALASHMGSGIGRGRGRGRDRGSRGAHVEKDDIEDDKYEDPPTPPLREDILSHLKSEEAVDDGSTAIEPTDIAVRNNSKSVAQRNFDLNLELNENEDTSCTIGKATTSVTPKTEKTDDELKHGEYPSWEMEKMTVDPVQYALQHQILEEEEDYDNEEG